MHENEDFGLEDFESALFDDDYQTGDDNDTDDSDVTETDDDPQDTDSDDQDEAEGDDSDEEDDTDDSEDDDADGSEEGDSSNTDADGTFTIKVNKEERKVTLEEMTTLAQKGADYDRVKEQNTRHQQTIADLQSKLEGVSSQQAVLDILDTIAQRSGSTLEQLAESLYVNFRKSAGASEDVAREELKSAKLEKELNSYTFAVKQSDGSITILNCVVSFAADGSWKRCGTISADGMALHVDTEDGHVVYLIQSYKDVVVEWAAFYEGSYTADTLPPYVPKGYGAELLECQRYYVPNTRTAVFVPANGYLTVYFPVDMRLESPTITAESSNDNDCTVSLVSRRGFVLVNNNAAISQIYWEASADL